MQKSLLLAKSNIHKAKGQIISIMVLVFIAACLLNLWLLLTLDYSKNFDRRSEMLNAEDDGIIYVKRDEDFIRYVSDILEKDSQTDRYYIDECIAFTASTRYRNGEMNTFYMGMPIERALEKEIGKYRIVEEDKSIKKNAVYLPLLYKEGGGYQTGDIFQFSLSGKKYKYTVAGFYENMLMGSFNGGICSLLFDADSYKKLEERNGEGIASILFSVQLKERKQNELYVNRVNNLILKKYPNVIYNYNWYDICKQARTMTASICSAVVSSVAFLIILIALIVIAFHISNYVQENMQTLGTLKALGYESGQIIRSFLVQFLGLGLIFICFGIGCSYWLYPVLNTALIAQTGIPYETRFLCLPFIMTICIFGGIIFITVYLSAGKIKKIEPITALRQGIVTHNFKRNYIPFEKTKLPLNTAFALKTTFHNLKQNITMFFIVIVLSILSVFCSIMMQNMVIDTRAFIGIIAGEYADIGIAFDSDENERIISEIKEDQRVEKIYLYNDMEIYHDKNNLKCYVTDDMKDFNNSEICYEGRLPQFFNEIALGGKYAAEHNIKVGDMITVEVNGNIADYLVCGLIQCSNFFGKDSAMTSEGYLRVGEFYHNMYYMNLKDGADAAQFLDDIKKKYGDQLYDAVNIQQVIEASLGVYTSLISMIVFVIILLSLIIITFVLYLMVKMLLNRKKKDYGILKSIGFTTKQLILQTAESFMPAMILAAAVGMVLGCVVMNPMLTLFFSGIGVMKCTFVVPKMMAVVFGVVMVVFAFCILCLISMRIRKITAYELMKE